MEDETDFYGAWNTMKSHPLNPSNNHFLCRLGLLAATIFTVLSIASPIHAGTITFGSGVNTFDMEFVSIGNPGNAEDTNDNTFRPNAGSVGYVYGIAKHEVSRSMIDIYNTEFGSSNTQVISLFDMTTLGGNGGDKPATGITWNEAARFVNWLNTISNGHAAYKFTGSGMTQNIARWDINDDPLDFNPSNLFRSKRATYVLPDYDEWYKAAYYDPSNSVYFDYANGKDTPPTAVLGTESGEVANTAVYGGDSYANYEVGPANINQAGGLSPYLVMGLGGNVREWNEDTFEFDYDPLENRILRGGDWYSPTHFLSSSSFNSMDPNSTGGQELNGFRVVMLNSAGGEVPEPTTMAIFGLGAVAFAYGNRRKRLSVTEHR